MSTPKLTSFPEQAEPQEEEGKPLSVRMSEMINKDNMNAILEKQEEILASLRRSNRSLDAFNSFSASRYEENVANIESYTNMLKEMKSDLEVVFKRIRSIKSRLASAHPAIYSSVVVNDEDEEDD
ncbi:KxDL motif-containing protein 1 [Phlyctochytrium bullatum]|nr:KxDL motif-containing protein 1 [Phlyctochytrium bullatum]